MIYNMFIKNSSERVRPNGHYYISGIFQGVSDPSPGRFFKKEQKDGVFLAHVGLPLGASTKNKGKDGNYSVSYYSEYR